MTPGKLLLLPTLATTVESLPIGAISEERKQILKVLIDYIRKKNKIEGVVKLNFICTHNSRRSQFSQIWAKVAADYYGIDVHCYSGGVEVTAFNERAVSTIKGAGFKVTQKGEINPTYFICYSEEVQPIRAFSKKYDDPINAASGFAAIMTCSHADENCPIIEGAEKRIPVRFDDPKEFDNTPKEAAMYEARSIQIATEMFYVFSQVNA